jgi:hypothetical protein
MLQPSWSFWCLLLLAFGASKTLVAGQPTMNSSSNLTMIITTDDDIIDTTNLTTMVHMDSSSSNVTTAENDNDDQQQQPEAQHKVLICFLSRSNSAAMSIYSQQMY